MMSGVNNFMSGSQILMNGKFRTDEFVCDKAVVYEFTIDVELIVTWDTAVLNIKCIKLSLLKRN